MFKAKKKNPKQKRTFRKKMEDDEEEDDKAEEGGAAESIARIKKKRKLLTELQFKKGTDAATLLKGRQKEEEDLAQNVETAADPSTTTASSSQEGIMEQKHKQALENYVESKLADMVGDKDNKDQPDKQDDNNNTSKKLTKDELYKQLAESSDHMVGRRPSATDSTKKDGDVGTGGAMLVAGTGLAEVILPVDQRLKAVQETQKETTLPPQAKNKNYYYYGMPSSQVPVPAGAARFQVSAADRHRHFASSSQHDSSKPSDTTTAAAQKQQEPQQETISNDQDRMGFDALRGKATAGTAGGTNSNSTNNNSSSGNHDHRNRASDDKVYGNFLKHHRENQWRTGR